ncbi:MAG: hypothetical protein B7X65_21580 [Polaromonas sp. 39-63-25]|uniref:hypothetical protein n=1 Tax=Polaromonas sp. 39-63-25 TaxID=1970420 RepID=UPI000BD353AA|nr:hypothetical protein [Polaromonas sp. 39-63-25]OZA85450.1 MAG: hypothetical protein B7X65_21580 [Polaromonas sp. 39-63-25]
MTWMRLAIIAAVLAALAAGAAAVRSHLIGVGEARTQARWDKQKAIDQAETLRLERERSADQLIKFRNAERISDEQAKRVTCPPPAAIPDLSPSLKVPPPQESFLEAATKLSSDWLQKLTASGTK